MKVTIKGILNESTKNDTLYNRILPLMKRPYGDFQIGRAHV